MIVLSYLTAWALGAGLWTWICREPKRNARFGFETQAVIALGLGLIVSSLLYFLWTLAFGTPNRAFAAMETIFGVIGLHSWWVLTLPGAPVERSDAPRWLVAAAIVVAAVAGGHFAIVSFAAPHGDGDAWMIWNLRAQYLVRGGDYWRNAFAPEIVHAAYPPFLSTLVSRGWVYAGHETAAVPISLAAVFTIGTAALLGGAVRDLRGSAPGLLAFTLLMGTPFFVTHGASQTADIPMGFNLLLAAVLLTFAVRYRETFRGGFFLAGLCVAAAAWTKNEGMMYALVLLATYACMTAWGDSGRVALHDMRLLVLGAIPVFVVLVYFKLALAPSTDLTRNIDAAKMLALATDPQRYLDIARGVWLLCARSPYRFVPLLLPVLLAYLWTAGIGPDPRDRTVVRTLAAALVLMCIGLLSVYVFTFWPVTKHVTESFDRLVLQLWPSCILCIFLAAKQPDTGVSPSS